MTWLVEVSADAADDLERLYAFAVDRELERAFGDPAGAARMLDAIVDQLDVLNRSPWTCRKAGDDPLVRELVIRHGHTGFVALFEIIDDSLVRVLAVRHQREEDYR